MALEEQLRQALAGTYRIHRELGGGGMSRVFAADETALGRRVALKVLSGPAAVVSADRFTREIQTIAKLQHPLIVPLLSAGTAGDTIYYTMPLVEGESLRARLDREGQLEIRPAVQFARDVAEALAYAHRHGVIHRDIKPDNVLVTDGHAVVTDFGVAKALALSTETGPLTTAGMAVGTPLYMAPEQALADPGADHRVDLYALGCLLYEMLIGRPPFAGGTFQQVISGHLSRTPESVSGLRPAVPPAVAAWVERALAKSPDERWPSADAALAELNACLAGLDGDRTATATSAGRRPHRLWLAAAVLLIVAAAGFAAYRAMGGASAAPEGPDRIAVIPFVPTDPSDTALARLGRDLVVTLTANLDGVGDLRMIDPLSILAQASSGSTRSPEQARAVAAGLGARTALIGSLVRVGSLVRLDYRLVRTSGSVTPLASGRVTAPFGDDGIIALTDSATWGMLAAILPSRGPLPSFELLHTRSVLALRAFIEGENLLLANRWTDAEQAYARAIEADSTFWFAYRRVVQAADWVFSADRRAREDSISRAHQEGLPERERLLMVHHDHDRFEDVLAALVEITRRFPDYWYGWFQYGDDLLHGGTRILLTPADAMEAFDRTLELNPGLIPVLDHRIIFMHDSAGAEQAYARLRAVYGPAWDTLRTDYGLRAETLYGTFLSRFRKGHLDPPVVHAYAMDLAGSRPAAVLLDWSVAIPVLAFDPRGQLEAARIVAREGAPAATLATISRWDAVAWAMRGAWDSATAALDRSGNSRPTLGLARVRAALGVMAFVTGATDSSVTVPARRGLAEFEGPPPAMALAARMLAFLDGMVAYAAQNRSGLDSARARLRRMTDDELAGWLERALGAFRLDLDGRRVEAGDSLAAIERERGVGGGFDYDPVPFIRLAAGRWQAAQGRVATADSLLSYYLSGAPNLPAQLIMKQTAGLAAFERAKAWDQAGDAARAADLYHEFLRLYDLPPAAHRAFVNDARASLVRLTRR